MSFLKRIAIISDIFIMKAMKKVSKFVLLPILCFSFTSLSACSKDDERVKLTYGEVSHQKYHDISYARLNAMIDAKESFLLVVDPIGCGCFTTFMKASEDYISRNHLTLYRIKVADFAGNNTHGIKVVEGNTTFAIFNEGSVQQVLVSNAQTEIMEKKEEFEEYISKYISKPNIYLVKPADLDVIYHTDNKATIYFGRNRCGDCSYINNHFLYDYMRDRDDILFVCDGDDIGLREYDEDGKLIDDKPWKAFKEKYGLTNVNNPTYGYDEGVVPTFLTISGNLESTTYHCGAVAFNDFVKKVGDLYLVTTNYYTAERQAHLPYAANMAPLQNLAVSKDQVSFYDEAETMGSWSKSASQSFYFTRVKAYLDSNLSVNNSHPYGVLVKN